MRRASSGSTPNPWDPMRASPLSFSKIRRKAGSLIVPQDASDSRPANDFWSSSGCHAVRRVFGLPPAHLETRELAHGDVFAECRNLGDDKLTDRLAPGGVLDEMLLVKAGVFEKLADLPLHYPSQYRFGFAGSRRLSAQDLF